MNLIKHPFDLVELEELMSGKYSEPLTVNEFRRFLLIKQEPSYLIDFYQDVIDYEMQYNIWKTTRKTSPNIKLIDSIEEDAVNIRPKEDQSVLFRSSVKLADGSNGVEAIRANQGGKTVTSSRISKLATEIFTKYLIRRSNHYLKCISENLIHIVLEKYLKVLNTAQKTGLRFMPSPDVAFKDLLKEVKTILEFEYLPGFVEYCICNLYHRRPFRLLRLSLYLTSSVILISVPIILVSMADISYVTTLILAFVTSFISNFLVVLDLNSISLVLLWKGTRQKVLLDYQDVIEEGETKQSVIANNISIKESPVLENLVKSLQRFRIARIEIQSFAFAIFVATVFQLIISVY